MATYGKKDDAIGALLFKQKVISPTRDYNEKFDKIIRERGVDYDYLHQVFPDKNYNQLCNKVTKWRKNNPDYPVLTKTQKKVEAAFGHSR